MKKGFTKYTAAWAILLALFNIIAFVSPGWIVAEKYSASFWTGYAFITLCFAGNLLCANFALKADNARKLVYKIPLIRLSYSALIVSFVVGGLCMLLSELPYFAGIIICAAILALYAIAVVKASAAAEVVEQADEKVKTQTEFIRNMTAEAENLMNHAQSPEAKAASKKVYEALRYSDPMSRPELYMIEAEIEREFANLSTTITEGSFDAVQCATNEVLLLIDSRNKKCKLVKR